MEPLSRPDAARPWGERVREWVVWFGVGRLVATSFATVVVVAGGVWLLHSPTPPTEASLTQATSPPTSAAAPSTSPNATQVPATDVDVPATMLVHVAGAVVEPGVYELAGDARVRDALVAAGGPSTDADWNALNLAAPLADGMRVYVPMVGEDVAGALVSGGSPPPELAGEQPPAGPVDLNRATAEELDVLPGVGPATAAAIVTERERSGPFATVDDLDRVPGIGPAKLEALRDLVTT